MLEMTEVKETLLDKEIRAVAVVTDDGMNITIAGGDRSHIGAVTVVDVQGNRQTSTFPGHKETVIAQQWAQAFYEAFHQPVVVSAGIHYDNLSKAGIDMVLETSDTMLKKLIRKIQQDVFKSFTLQ